MPNQSVFATLDLLIQRHVYFSLKVLLHFGCWTGFSIVECPVGRILHDRVLSYLAGLLRGKFERFLLEKTNSRVLLVESLFFAINLSATPN